MARQYPDPMLKRLILKGGETDPHIRLGLSKWMHARNAITSGLVEQGVLEDWLNGASTEEPDLVEYLSNYTYSFILTRSWRELPIRVSEEEAPAYREHNYGTTLTELQFLQLGVLGGFLSLCGRDPAKAVALMQRQLRKKLDQLNELLAQPLETFTPTPITPEDEWNGEDDEIRDDDKWRFNQPFDLFDQLTYFAYGMEHARMRSFDENPLLGLPNVDLFNALREIDLPSLLGELKKHEAGLKRILRHLAKHQGNNLVTNREEAPDEAWWRHWKAEKPRRRDNRKR